MKERLDAMEKHLLELQAEGEDVEVDLARVRGMRRTLQRYHPELFKESNA